MRDRTSTVDTYRSASDNAALQLLQAVFGYLLIHDKTIETPTNSNYTGIDIDVTTLCGVSVVRAGESMEGPLRQLFPKIAIGKILIQRDEETLKPKLYHTKLPKNIAERTVIVMEPMLATGGTALCTIKTLLDFGVSENKIIFVSFVGCRTGLDKVQKTHPKVQFIIGEIDPTLNSVGYIIPGLGDAGDRYFGTT